MKKKTASFPKVDPIEFTQAQLEMLEMSAADIREGRIIAHEELIKETKQWLNKFSNTKPFNQKKRS